MDISYINENTNESEAMFTSTDKRSYFYESITYVPTSIVSPIIWSDENIFSDAVFDITNSGDLSVTSAIAKVFMSFDPYGITVLPNRLKCYDQLSEEKRYIIAINNELDVMDENKSSFEVKIRQYDPEKHGYNVPIEEQKSLITKRIKSLYIDEGKLKSYPENKRHIFRVKGTNNFFFSSQMFDEIYKIALNGLASGLTAFKFSSDDKAPRR